MAIQTTLIQIVKNAAATGRGITFINASDDEEYLSYQQLYQNALHILYSLQNSGIKPGDELIFQLEDNQAFVTSFWACILGGILPVPVTVGKTAEHKRKLFTVWKILTKPYLMTEKKTAGVIREFCQKTDNAAIAEIDSRMFIFEKVKNTKPGTINNVKSGDTAYIQFSSGSTGDPKGVIITHENLTVNTKAIIKQAKITDEDKMLSWMPLTHDMGLILAHLTATHAGIDQYLMPPSLFVEDPVLWLEKTNEHRATILYSPNFGYQYILNFFNDNKKWDLSCVRILFNGAEPISYSVSTLFLEKFKKYGLKETAMYPGYGMAEAAVAVTISRNPEDGIIPVYCDREHLSVGEKMIENKNGAVFVDLGHVVDDLSLRICDNDNTPLEDGRIGHILLKGKSVSSGYYNNKKATQETITGDGWLKTGDIGFVNNDRLVITGRAKEVIIFHGQNYYAEDLERIAQTVEGIELEKAAVVGIYNEERQKEEILFFIRFSKRKLKEFSELARKLRDVFLKELGIHVDYSIPVRRIPRTTSGKLQRYKLAEEYKKGSYKEILDELAVFIKENQTQTTGLIKTLIKKKDKKALASLIIKEVETILGYTIPDYDEGFSDLGIDSVKMVMIKERFENMFDFDFPASFVMDYPDINRMISGIDKMVFPGEHDILNEKAQKEDTEEQKVKTAGKKETNHGDIAIIGMACRFPGSACTPGQFWDNLIANKEVTRPIPFDRWNGDKSELAVENGYFIDDIDMFAPGFFNISPVEALHMDPQQRILLETSWMAFENAGINPKKLRESSTGVFIGIAAGEYDNLTPKTDSASHELTGLLSSTASGRLSYFYGLQGPSLSIDTACSSSLVAVHNACLGLLTDECSLAVCGGVSLITGPKIYHYLEQFGALSPDGKCKTFDERADGYGRGEGCGLILLKRLADAESDGDSILGVIKGSAVNHDGPASGLTVPNGKAQERVILKSLEKAGLNPGDIDYIEAHGTGTKIGDPQEVTALSSVFGENRNKDLLIGSVKSHVGHLEMAAGVAGIIKVVLSLQHNTLPGQLFFTHPNTFIPWDKLKIKVVEKNCEWKKEGQRRAGVSSFGMSGTNAHLIIEEYQKAEQKSQEARAFSGYHMLTFSAKTEDELQKLAKLYHTYLQETEIPIEDICYTSVLSRTVFKKRLLFFCKTKQEFLTNLHLYLEGGISKENYRENIRKTLRESKKGEQFSDLINKYLEGEKVDISSWYSPKMFKKAVLPGYPFSKESFWFFPLQKTVSKKSADDPVNRLIYSLDWLPEENGASPAISSRDLYVLFADKQGTGEQTADYISQMGGQSVVCYRENFKKELPGVIKKIGKQEYQSVFMIYLYPMDISFKDDVNSGEIKEQLKEQYTDIFYLLSSISKISSGTGYKLWIITRDGMVLDEKYIPNLITSTLWGFSAALDHELAEHWGGVIDFTGGGVEGNERIEENQNKAEKILREITAEKESRIGFCGGKRYVQRLCPTKKDPGKKTLPIDKNGAYLITGGMGIIGFRLARWLLEKGATKLFLAGRRELTAEKKEQLAALQTPGVLVEYLQCDVAHEQAVFKIMEQLKSKGHTLKGIIHAAGTSDVLFALEHTWESFWKILSSKVAGTWNLYRAVRNIKLDFFILTSSMSSFMGNVGITAYTAANDFLNFFACYAKSKKLPVTSINIGFWGESAGLMRGSVSSHVKRLGFLPINTENGLKALERGLLSGYSAPVILAMDWQKFADHMTKKQKTGIFSLIRKNLQKTEDHGVKVVTGTNAKPEDEDPRQKLTFLISTVREQVGAILGFASGEEIDIETPFADLGMDSILALKIVETLNEKLDLKITPPLLFNYTTIQQLAAYILESGSVVIPSAAPAAEEARSSIVSPGEKIAIIGMGGRFPGADTLDEFWNNLMARIDSVSQVPPNRWNLDLFYDPDHDKPGKIYTKNGGFLKNIDLFDADFFGISPVEAREMDPQQRHLLEVSWLALENAGLAVSKLKNSKTGVFIGITNTDYQQKLYNSAETQNIDIYSVSGAALSTTFGNISFFYDFKGPALAIDTACSSSLVSLHLAVQSLLTGESNLALAGGVNTITNPAISIGLSKMNVLSADGKCKSFDDSANGFVRAEGCGLLVLKRLSEAEQDGDRILGVIKGSAVNHNGRSAGKTAPNGIAQEMVIREALQNSNCLPDDIDYIEAHGTGTNLGDPIEINALGAIFRQRSRPLLIGSVKSNIGHAESAAGVAGIIKILLSFKNRILPPGLHFYTPNKHINWAGYPIKVITKSTPWPSTGKPRIAGVTSLGMSGTNAHVILEEYLEKRTGTQEVKKDTEKTASSYAILTLSAKNRPGLLKMVEKYKKYLRETNEALEDICYTSIISRAFLEEKAAFVAPSKEQMAEQLAMYIKHGDPGMESGVEEKIKENEGTVFLKKSGGSLWSMNVRYMNNSTECFLQGDKNSDTSWKVFLEKLSLIYRRKINIDWEQFAKEEKQKKVELPSYPFDRKSYWKEIKISPVTSTGNMMPKENKQEIQKEEGSTFPSREIMDLEMEVTKLIEDNTGLTPEVLESNKDETFYVLGFDSLLITMIRSKLNEKFDLNIQTDQMFVELDTFNKVVKYIADEKGIIEKENNQRPLNEQIKPEEVEDPGDRGTLLIPFRELALYLRKEYNRLTDKEELLHLRTFFDLLNDAGLWYIVNALLELGVDLTKAGKIEPEKLATELEIVPRQKRYFLRLFLVLEHFGFLINHVTHYTIGDSYPLPSINKIEHEIGGNYADYIYMFKIIRRCGENLAGLLKGTIDYVSVLFSDSDKSLEYYYHNEPQLKQRHTLIRQALEYIIKKVPEQKGIKILELGAGTGSAAKIVLPALDPGKTEYYFTDIGNYFLINAKKIFSRYNFITYEKLDINNQDDMEKMKDIGFDIIIASNVVHATPSIVTTIKNIKKLLTPDGYFFMVEATFPPCWADIPFGMVKEWWSYEDFDLRQNSPLLDQTGWTKALLQSGFENFTFFPVKKQRNYLQPLLIAVQAVQKGVIESESPANPKNETNPGNVEGKSVHNDFYRTDSLSFKNGLSKAQVLNNKWELTGETLDGLTVDREIKKNIIVSQYVKISDKQALQVILAGNGETVLILPGFGGTAKLWINQIGKLAEHYRVVVIHGPECLSGIGFDKLIMEKQADLISSAVSTLGMDYPSYVIGSSYGGMLAQKYVKEHSSVIQKLILVCSFNYMNKMVFKMDSSEDIIKNELDTIIAHTGPERIKNKYDLFKTIFLNGVQLKKPFLGEYIKLMKQGVSSDDVLPLLKMPLLIIGGTYDPVFEQAKLLHSKVPHSVFREIAGGHFPYITHEEKFAKMVRDFLGN